MALSLMVNLDETTASSGCIRAYCKGRKGPRAWYSSLLDVWLVDEYLYLVVC
jgi:hypothetical protein